MTDIIIRAERAGTVQNIPIQIGMDFFDAKFDTGSSVTVISIAVFYDCWSDDEINKLEEFCENKGCVKCEFTSASGHKIKGFPVTAKNVLVGDTIFPEFHYYLITNGRREMSLIGDDFIDNCKYSHEPHGDVLISGFDFESYCDSKHTVMDSEDILAFIDQLIC